VVKVVKAAAMKPGGCETSAAESRAADCGRAETATSDSGRAGTASTSDSSRMEASSHPSAMKTASPKAATMEATTATAAEAAAGQRDIRRKHADRGGCEQGYHCFTHHDRVPPFMNRCREVMTLSVR